VRNAPKPPKPLCKLFFAVLQRDRFERSGNLLICKILPKGGEDYESQNEANGAEDFRKSGRSLMCKAVSTSGQEGNEEFEIQMIEMEPDQIGLFFNAWDRHVWCELGSDYCYDESADQSTTTSTVW
jgi:hypothetical protein